MKLIVLALGAASLSCLLACGPGGIDDSGAADITLESADESLQLVHDAALSQISVTPPTSGVVELLFSYQDPLVDVLVRLDANEVAAGEVVSLPSDPSRFVVSVLWGEGEYRSEEGSSGSADVQSLETDEDAGYATVSVSLDAQLADTGTGDTITVSGFLEGTVGSDPAAAGG